MNHRLSLTIALGAALPGVACAQDSTPAASADILVVGQQQNALTLPTMTGSRLNLTPLETPASVTSLAGDEIRLRGDLSLVEAVTRAPGFTSVANPGNGGTALATRGFSGQGSVLQLVDGIRLFPVAGTITFPTDTWMVDRVEILNGPASVLYGQGALGGAVNFVSKQPNAMRSEAAVEASYGSQNTAHLAAGVGGPINEVFSYRADASWRRSDGYVDRGRSRSIALSGAIRFAPTERFSMTLRNDYGEQRPTRYFGTPLIDGVLRDANRHRNYNVADASLHYRDNHSLLTAEWSPSSALTLRNDAYRLTSRRLFKNLEQYCYVAAGGLCRNGGNDGSDAFDPAPAGTIYRYSNLGIDHDQTQYGDQGSARLSTPLGGTISNDLVVGFDVNAIRLTYSNDFGSDPQEDVVDPYRFAPGRFFDTQGIAPRYNTRTHEYAFFAEDRLKLGPQLSVVAGVRYEHDAVTRRNIRYNPNGTTTEVNAFPNGMTEKNLRNTTFRVGAVYQPTPALSLYAQYSTGVDPLGTLTTFTTNAAQFAFTNATGNQVEIGAKASFLDGRGSATLAGYRIVKHDLVAQRTPTSPIQQIGQRSSRGIEASVTVALAQGFSIDANGTVLDAKYDDFVSGGTSYTGKTPSNIPETSGNLWLRWSHGRLSAQGGVRYVGHTWSDDANSFRIPAYVVADAGASYAVTRAIAVDLRVSNLFDRKYVTNSYDNEQWILGRPRSVDVSLRARF